MRGPIRTLVAVDEGFPSANVVPVLDDSGIEIVGVVADSQEWETLHETDADALIIACANKSNNVIDLIGESVRRRPDRPVVVVCTEPPNGFSRQVLEVGADDIVLVTNTDTPSSEAFFALEKAMARRSSSNAQSSNTCEMVCVLGPKGGIGKTLTAVNLSVALAEADKKVVLVDLDLQFGDVGLSMGLTPRRTIFDLVMSGGTLDENKIEGFLTEHPSGVKVLLAPVRPDHASSVSIDFLSALYRVLRNHYDYIVVDTPPKFDPEVITTIDASTSICMVGTLDATSLKNTRLGLETLELMGYQHSRIKVVLNRADTSVGMANSDAIAILGRTPDIHVPSDRDVVRSVNAGEPIVSFGQRSAPAQAFRDLAASYHQLRDSRSVDSELSIDPDSAQLGQGTVSAKKNSKHDDKPRKSRRTLLGMRR